MRDLVSKRPDNHPPPELILRYMDGSLEGEDLAVFIKHLAQCWMCMAELEEVKAGICSFMEFRSRLLPVIPVDSRGTRIRLSLTEAAGKQEDRRTGNLLFRFTEWIGGSRLRPAWIAGVLSAVVLGYFLFLSLAAPPRLMAEEFLRRAATSIAEVKRLEQHNLVREIVRVQWGASTAQRRIIRGPAASPVSEGAAPAWAATLLGPLKWNDPLDLESFLKWRADQSDRIESVSSNTDLITLTTRTNGSSAVHEASITARRSDWHIVAKQVQMQNGRMIKATEIAYEVRELPSLTPGDRAGSTHVRNTQRQQRPAAGPSREDMDEAEIQVRTLLFRLAFGLGEEEVAPSVHRGHDGIAVEGVISAADRRELLASNLAAMPYAIDLVSDRMPAAPLASGPVELPATARPVAPAQLRKMLVERLGSEQAATDFANRVLADSGRLFALAVQYHELAKRYTAVEMESLSPEVRAQTVALAQQMNRAALEKLQTQERTLGALRQPGAAVPESPEAPTPWQETAERVFRTASMYDRLIARLFAVTASGAEDHDTPERNLEQLESQRRELKRLLSAASGS